jgi:hypothetical protein
LASKLGENLYKFLLFHTGNRNDALHIARVVMESFPDLDREIFSDQIVIMSYQKSIQLIDEYRLSNENTLSLDPADTLFDMEELFDWADNFSSSWEELFTQLQSIASEQLEVICLRLVSRCSTHLTAEILGESEPAIQDLLYTGLNRLHLGLDKSFSAENEQSPVFAEAASKALEAFLSGAETGTESMPYDEIALASSLINLSAKVFFQQNPIAVHSQSPEENKPLTNRSTTRETSHRKKTQKSLTVLIAILILVVGIFFTILFLPPRNQGTPREGSFSPAKPTETHLEILPSQVVPTHSVQGNFPEMPGFRLFDNRIEKVHFLASFSKPEPVSSVSSYQITVYTTSSLEEVQKIKTRLAGPSQIYETTSEKPGINNYLLVSDSQRIFFDNTKGLISIIGTENQPSLTDADIASFITESLGLSKTDIKEAQADLANSSQKAYFQNIHGKIPVIQQIPIAPFLSTQINDSNRTSFAFVQPVFLTKTNDHPVRTFDEAWASIQQGDPDFPVYFTYRQPETTFIQQAWLRTFKPGETVNMYGQVELYQAETIGQPFKIILNHIELTGDPGEIREQVTQGKMIHIWGTAGSEEEERGQVVLQGWEESTLSQGEFKGTIQQTNLGAMLKTLDGSIDELIDPPTSLPQGAFLRVNGVIVDERNKKLDWYDMKTYPEDSTGLQPEWLNGGNITIDWAGMVMMNSAPGQANSLLDPFWIFTGKADAQATVLFIVPASK